MTPLTLEELQLRATCSALIVRAASHADQHNARGLADLFAENGTLTRPGGQPLQGREAIYQAYAQRPPERMTRHLVTNTEFEFLSATEVRAVSYVLVIGGSALDADSAKGRLANSCQMGELRDLLTLGAHGWQIQQRDAHFVLYVE